MRSSRQREAILRVVRGAVCHPTAEWVYAQVKREIPGISLGTVYRNLKLLTETGAVRSYEGVGGVSRYDGCTAAHYHFRCEECGTLIDVEEPVNGDLDRRVAVSTGLHIRCHVLEFRGLCPACHTAEAMASTVRVGSRVAAHNREVCSDGSILGG